MLNAKLLHPLQRELIYSDEKLKILVKVLKFTKPFRKSNKYCHGLLHNFDPHLSELFAM